MILALALVFYVLHGFINTIKNITYDGKINIKIKSTLIFILLSLILLIISFIYIDEILKNDYLQRALSSLDLKSSGNNSRIILWKKGISMWMNTNLFIGEYTGIITNSTANFGGISTVVESGLIQQLLNFGLIATISYYINLCLIVKYTKKEFIILRSMAISCIIQTFIYQSIEVLPYMFILTLVPITSTWINLKKEQFKEV